MDNNGGDNFNQLMWQVAIVLQSPPPHIMPRTSIPAGYIFVCDNISMLEFTTRQLFGMPYLYMESVRAIRPRTPLFLYNFETGHLHGVYEAISFGGEFDPTLCPAFWNPGISQFPAQVRVRRRMMCRSLSGVNLMRYVYYLGGIRVRAELTPSEASRIMELFRLLAYNQ